MKKILVLLFVPALAGCLTSNMPTSAYWPIDYVGKTAAVDKPKFGVVRLSQVNVRPPYGTAEICVLRSNGAVAFDAYNGFATVPSQLLRGPITDAFTASGLFRTVVGASSTADAEFSAEVVVTRLALDCRTDGVRMATVDVTVRLLKGREIVSLTSGEAKADAADGNFGLAFSKAVSDALHSALLQIRQ